MTWFLHCANRRLILPVVREVLRCAVQRNLLLLAVTLATFGASHAQGIATSGKIPVNPTVDPSTFVLKAGKPLVLTLQPGGNQLLAFEIHQDRYREVQLRQIHGMSQTVLVPPDGKASVPYINDGGTGSIRRIPVVSSADATYYVRIQSRERHATVTCSVTLLPERPIQAHDKEVVQAEVLLAEAEWKRRKPDSPSSAQIQTPEGMLAQYDQVLLLAQQSNDIALQRRALIGKARFQIYRIGQYQQGVLSATQATQLPSATPDLDQQALAWKTLASAQAFINHYEESIAASERALVLYRSTGDLYWQGIVLGNLADIEREVGNSAQALESAKESLHIAQQLGDDYGVAFTQSTMGEIYQGNGDYQHALSAYERALDTTNIISYPQVKGEVWSDLGQLYTQLGDWERADNAYQQALPILQKTGDVINEIEVRDRLGELALHSSKPALAQEYFLAGVKRAQDQKLVREETFLSIGLARTCMQIPCRRHPVEILSGALGPANAIHQIDGEAAIEAALGDAYAARGHDAMAMRAYAQSATLWQRVPNSSELAAVEADMARLDLRQGRLQAARQQIYDGLDSIESSRAQIESDALRTSYFSAKHNYYDLAVDILMQLDRANPNHGYGEEAWRVAERARARTLQDALQTSDYQDATESSKKKHQVSAALDRKVQDDEDQLVRLGASNTDIAKAAQLEKEIHNLLLQADQLETHLTAPASASGGMFDAPHLSVSDFSHTVLDNHTALLEYWIGTRQSYLWILTQNGMQSFRLPNRARLQTLIHTYQQSLLARDVYVSGEDMQARVERIAKADNALHTESFHLARTLLPAALSHQVERLILVADGDVLSLPFAALEESHPRSAAANYMIQHYDLVYEPSASTAATLLAQQRRSVQGQRIAIFADPVYSNTDSRLQAGQPVSTTVALSTPIARTASPENWMQLPRLPGSRKEAVAIAEIAGANNTSLFLDFNASPESFHQLDWKSYRVAHFAAHAMVDMEHPEFSGIVLSMVHPNGTPADGLLWLHDIYRLRLPVSLVTLSGCQTADGKSVPGEGVNGLSRAFLYAGARSVIGTLWNADDNSSNELMQTFYGAFLNRHHSAASALRSAQLAVLSDPEHQAPYYWAGFVLEGDWQGR